MREGGSKSNVISGNKRKPSVEMNGSCPELKEGYNSKISQANGEGNMQSPKPTNFARQARGEVCPAGKGGGGVLVQTLLLCTCKRTKFARQVSGEFRLCSSVRLNPLRLPGRHVESSDPLHVHV